jgi:DNA-directed RNA polymerase
MFDEGKELGKNGLRWLKIHCANLAGYDKASFTDRVKFVNENLEEVFDSAVNPLGVCISSLSCTYCADCCRVIDGG